ncbi:MAG: sigma-54-dependent Fis family transcriptional regulator [Acidobacteria bacterium]|nr:sigma-54-dependent Fis family transcriptional regulator [Acidobacteriota bacterium]
MSKTILVVDDERLLRWSVRQKLEGWGYNVMEAESGIAALQALESQAPDAVTLDMRLPDLNGLELLIRIKKQWPDLPVLMMTGHGTISDAVRSLQLGAFDFLEKPINFERLENTLKNALESHALRTVVERVTSEIKAEYSIDNIVGNSPAIQDVKALVQKLAVTETTTLLIEGESGTGKDLVAKALHYHSRRARQPFVIQNCAALPETLMESELYGYEKGAFTDARATKKGLFELADGGTIFLDEIGELPLHLQSKLLRVLEDQCIRRIGGVKDIHIDVRVVAASNRNLLELVKKKGFREDLFYRLSIIPIWLPPLRERKQDIPVLLKHFISLCNVRLKKSIRGVTKTAEKMLMEYQWPGNVRELKNAVERAMILATADLLDDEHFHIQISTGALAELESQGDWRLPPNGLSLYDVEKLLIQQAIEMAHGNKTNASKLLHISRDTLRYKIKKYRIAAKG